MTSILLEDNKIYNTKFVNSSQNFDKILLIGERVVIWEKSDFSLYQFQSRKGSWIQSYFTRSNY